MEHCEEKGEKRKWYWFELGQVKQASYYKLQLILPYTKFNTINYQNDVKLRQY